MPCIFTVRIVLRFNHHSYWPSPLPVATSVARPLAMVRFRAFADIQSEGEKQRQNVSNPSPSPLSMSKSSRFQPWLVAPRPNTIPPKTRTKPSLCIQWLHAAQKGMSQVDQTWGDPTASHVR